MQENRKSRYERDSKPKKEYNSKRENPRQHPKPDKEKRDKPKNACKLLHHETAIGKITSTIPNLKNSKVKQGTGKKKRKVKRTEGQEKK